MIKFRNKLIAVLLCLVIVISSGIVPEAATRTDVNNVARNLLAEYYNPTDCLNTGLYNIENCYTQQAYENKDQLNKIYEKAESLTASAKNDTEKVKLIHDWMCRNINYADNLSSYNGYPYSPLANPFTVFKDKQAVCYGFANLTQLMLQHIGIPCVIVRGNSSSHVWNAVYLDKKWVFTDNTWDENLTTTDKISYKYYLMSNETYDNFYSTQYIENWAGDACYFPVYVTTSYAYHSLILNSKGGKCPSRLPFSENMDKFPIPVPERTGRTFSKWTNDKNIDGYYYAGFGGWYLSGGVKGQTTDITFTALYNKVNPDYEVPDNLIGYEGDTLADVSLPTGFSWVDSSQKLTEVGEFTFKVNYTPEDLDDYNVVKNIEVKVTVKNLSAEIIDDAKETVKKSNNELYISNELHEEMSAILKSAQTESSNEETSVKNITDSLNSKLTVYQASVTKANEAVNKAEQAYSDLKNKKISVSEAKAKLEEANKAVVELESSRNNLKNEIESAKSKTFAPIETIWSDSDLKEEVSILESLLLDVNSTLAGVNKLAESQSSQELTSLIETLSGLSTDLDNSLQSIRNIINLGENIVAKINETRGSLKTAIGVAETELNASNIIALKDRLAKAVLKELPASSVKISATRYTYNGKAFKPSVTIKGLVKDKDFTVSYSNNTNIGTGKVTIKGKGGYTGTVVKTFTIIAPTPSISKLSISKKTTCKIKVKSLAGVSKYQVAYRIKGKTWQYKTLSPSKNILILKGLKRKKTYQIKVRALCSNKYSSYSKIKSIRSK